MTSEQTPCAHEWHRMSWQEAYPASDGYKCALCGKIKLGWFGTQVSKADLEKA